MRNFAGSQIVAIGFGVSDFEAEDLEEEDLEAEDFAARCLDEAAGFADAACFGGLLTLDEPLKTSDSQLAWPISIGNNNDAASAAAATRRQREVAKPASADFFPDDGNRCFPTLIRRMCRPASMAAAPTNFNSLYAS
jgi:hypothetical protein